MQEARIWKILFGSSVLVIALLALTGRGDTPSVPPQVDRLEETCMNVASNAYRVGYDRGQTDAVLGMYQPDVRANTFRIRILEDAPE